LSGSGLTDGGGSSHRAWPVNTSENFHRARLCARAAVGIAAVRRGLSIRRNLLKTRPDIFAGGKKKLLPDANFVEL
jgi:hypothetical protein